MAAKYLLQTVSVSGKWAVALRCNQPEVLKRNHDALMSIGFNVTDKGHYVVENIGELNDGTLDIPMRLRGLLGENVSTEYLGNTPLLPWVELRGLPLRFSRMRRDDHSRYFVMVHDRTVAANYGQELKAAGFRMSKKGAVYLCHPDGRGYDNHAEMVEHLTQASRIFLQLINRKPSEAVPTIRSKDEVDNISVPVRQQPSFEIPAFELSPAKVTSPEIETPRVDIDATTNETTLSEESEHTLSPGAGVFSQTESQQPQKEASRGLELAGLEAFRHAAVSVSGPHGTAIVKNNWHVTVGGFPPVVITLSEGKIQELATYVSDADVTGFELREVFRFNEEEKLVAASGKYPMIGHVQMSQEAAKLQFASIAKYSTDALRSGGVELLANGVAAEDALLVSYKNAHNPNIVTEKLTETAVETVLDEQPEVSDYHELVEESTVESPKDINRDLFVGTNLFGEEILADNDGKHFTMHSGEKIYAAAAKLADSAYNSVRFLKASQHHASPTALALIAAGFEANGDPNGISALFDFNELSKAHLLALNAGSAFAKANADVWESIVPTNDTPENVFENAAGGLSEYLTSLAMKNGPEWLKATYGDSNLTDIPVQRAIEHAEKMSADLAAKTAVDIPPAPKPTPKPSAPTMESVASRVKEIFEYEQATLSNSDLIKTIGGKPTTSLTDVFALVSGGRFLESSEVDQYPELLTYFERAERLGWYPLTEENKRAFVLASANLGPSPATERNTATVPGDDPEAIVPDISPENTAAFPDVVDAMAEAGYMLADESQLELIQQNQTVGLKAASADLVFVGRSKSVETLTSPVGESPIVLVRNAGAFSNDSVKGKAEFAWNGTITDSGVAFTGHTTYFYENSADLMDGNDGMVRNHLLAGSKDSAKPLKGSLQNPNYHLMPADLKKLEVREPESIFSRLNNLAVEQFASEMKSLKPWAVRAVEFINDELQTAHPALVFNSPDGPKAFVGVGAKSDVVFNRIKVANLMKAAMADNGYFARVRDGLVPGSQWQSGPEEFATIKAITMDGRLAVEVVRSEFDRDVKLYRTTDSLIQNSDLVYYKNNPITEKDNEQRRTGRIGDQPLDDKPAEENNGTEPGRTSGVERSSDPGSEKDADRSGRTEENAEPQSNGSGVPGAEDAHSAAGGEYAEGNGPAGSGSELRLKPEDYRLTFHEVEDSDSERTYSDFDDYSQYTGTVSVAGRLHSMHSNPETGLTIITTPGGDGDFNELLGLNSAGRFVYSDSDGVRHYEANSGMLSSEKVTVSPAGGLTRPVLSTDFIVTTPFSTNELSHIVFSEPKSQALSLDVEGFWDVAGARLTEIREQFAEYVQSVKGEDVYRALAAGHTLETYCYKNFTSKLPELNSDQDQSNGLLHHYLLDSNSYVKQALISKTNGPVICSDHLMGVVEKYIDGVHKQRFDNNAEGFSYGTILEGYQKFTESFGGAYLSSKDFALDVVPHMLYESVDAWLEATENGETAEEPVIRTIASKGSDMGLFTVNVLTGEAQIEKTWQRTKKWNWPEVNAIPGMHLQLDAATAWPPAKIGLGILAKEALHENNPDINAFFNHEYGDRLYQQHEARLKLEANAEQEADVSFFAESVDDEKDKTPLQAPGTAIMGDLFAEPAETELEQTEALELTDVDLPADWEEAVTFMAYAKRYGQTISTSMIDGISHEEIFKFAANHYSVTDNQVPGFVAASTELFEQTLATDRKLFRISDGGIDALKKILPAAVNKPISGSQWKEAISESTTMYTARFAGIDNPFRKALAEQITEITNLLEDRAQSAIENNADKTYVDSLLSDLINVRVYMPAVIDSYLHLREPPVVKLEDKTLTNAFGTNKLHGVSKLFNQLNEKSPISFDEYRDYLAADGREQGLSTSIDSGAINDRSLLDSIDSLTEYQETIKDKGQPLRLDDKLYIGPGSAEIPLNKTLVKHINQLLEAGGATREQAEEYGILPIVFTDPNYNQNGGYHTIEIGIDPNGKLSHYTDYFMVGYRKTDGEELDFEFSSGRGTVFGRPFFLYEDKQAVKVNLSNFGSYLSLGVYAVNADFLEQEMMYTGKKKSLLEPLPEPKPVLIHWDEAEFDDLVAELERFANEPAREPEPIKIATGTGFVERKLLNVGVNSIEVSDGKNSEVLSYKTAFGLNDRELSQLKERFVVAIPQIAMPAANMSAHDLGLFTDPAVYYLKKQVGSPVGPAGVGTVLVNYDQNSTVGSAPGDIFAETQLPNGDTANYAIAMSNRPLVLNADESGLVTYEQVVNKLSGMSGRFINSNLPAMLGAADSTGPVSVKLHNFYENPELRDALLTEGFDAVVVSYPNSHGTQIRYVALDDKAVGNIPRSAITEFDNSERLTADAIADISRAIVENANSQQVSQVIDYLITELNDSKTTGAAYLNTQSVLESIHQHFSIKELNALANDLNIPSLPSLWVANSFARSVTASDLIVQMKGMGYSEAQAKNVIQQAYIDRVIPDAFDLDSVYNLSFANIPGLMDPAVVKQLRGEHHYAQDAQAVINGIMGRFNPDQLKDVAPDLSPIAEALLKAADDELDINPLAHINAKEFTKLAVIKDSLRKKNLIPEEETPQAPAEEKLSDEHIDSPIADIAASIETESESQPSTHTVNYDYQLYSDALLTISEDLNEQMVPTLASSTITDVISYHDAFPKSAEEFVAKYVEFGERVMEQGRVGVDLLDTGFVANTLAAAREYKRFEAGELDFSDLVKLTVSQWALGQQQTIPGIEQSGLGANINSSNWARVHSHIAVQAIEALIDKGAITAEAIDKAQLTLQLDYEMKVGPTRLLYDDVDVYQYETGSGPVLFGMNKRDTILYALRLDSNEKVNASAVRDIRQADASEYIKSTVLPEPPAELLVAMGNALAEELDITFDSTKIVDQAVKVKADKPAASQTQQSSPIEAEVTDKPAVAGTDNSILVPSELMANEVQAELTSSATSQLALFERNIAAIEILKELNAGEVQRLPSAEERKKLLAYAGWGSLSNAFRQTDGTYVKGWEERAKKLENLLDRNELRAARSSTTSAFFTNPDIAVPMYEGLKRMGVSDSQTWLEPSVGVGNFFGLMPEGMAKNAKRVGVEKDPVTAAIARAIYGTPDALNGEPETKIINSGFEKVHFHTGEIDVCIANPPFGQTRLHDAINTRFNNMSIHNYFTCRSLEALRPGGVKAMVVSRYLMDGQDTRARLKMAEMAELVGAYRLPETAFSEAGTKVVSDVLFFQRREQDLDLSGNPSETPDWVRTRTVELPSVDGTRTVQQQMNSYFIQNEGHVFGNTVITTGAFREGLNVIETADIDWREALADAVQELPRGIYKNSEAARRLEFRKENANGESLVTGDQVPGKAWVLGNGTLFWDDTHGVMRKEPNYKGEHAAAIVKTKTLTSGLVRELKASETERLGSMVRIREQLDRLIRMEQTIERGSERPAQERQKLNNMYDVFVSKFGFLNSRTNTSLMRQDAAWGRLSALEDYSPAVTIAQADQIGTQPKKETAEKSAIFKDRLSFPQEDVESASTYEDALILSIIQKGGVDVVYIAELVDKSVDEVISGLEGEIFYNPSAKSWEHKDIYLAGNVKEKFETAKLYADSDPRMSSNMVHLQNAFPVDVEPQEVGISFGAKWVPAQFYEKFINQLTGSNIKAEAVYIDATGSWNFKFEENGPINDMLKVGRSKPRRILSKIASNAPIKIMTTRFIEGREKSVIDPEATERASQISKNIRRKWDEWVDSEPGIRDELAKLYNATVNVYTDRPLTTPANIDFPGKVDDSIIELRGHQTNYVWTSLLKTVSAAIHDTGAGKTFAQISATMKLRSIGKVKKPLFVVPNHLTGQWVSAFTALFPAAKVLHPGTNGFTPNNRNRLFGQIATGDWDAIIIGDSQLKRLPIDYEMAQAMYEEETEALEYAVRQMDQFEDRITIKRLETRLDTLKNQFEAMMSQLERDGGTTWNMLGIDQLVVDELQRFKNLGYATSLQVAGLGDTVGSQKSFDLFVKIRATLRNGGRFSPLTATPIANTLAEFYTFQRYTMYDDLVAQGLHHFDAWVNQYGNISNTYELDATGVNYKQVQRLASFKNMPELMSQYRNVAHVVTLDDIRKDFEAQGKTWIFPDIKGGAPENIVVPRTELQALYMEFIVSRAEKIEEGLIDPRDDNKLVVTTDARKAAIDMRLIDDSYVDSGKTKLDEASDRVYQTFEEWDSLKGTQIVFCDFGIPKTALAREQETLTELMERVEGTDPDDALKAQAELDKYSIDEKESILGANSFSVYDELKTQLVQKGMQPEQVAFIHDAKNERQREALFERVRAGDVRVLIGSTSKLGEGTNVQDRLVALRNMDCPWRPDQMKQRVGRIVRQGNLFKQSNPDFEVIVENLATENTYDARMYMLNKTKAIMLGQVTTGRLTDRVVDDITPEAASASEMAAAASGNPLILKEFSLKKEMKDKEGEYREALRQHQIHYRRLEETKQEISKLERMIEVGKPISEEFNQYPEQVQIKGKSGKTAAAFVPYTCNKNGIAKTANEAARFIIASILEKEKMKAIGHSIDYELGKFGSLALAYQEGTLWNSKEMQLVVLSNTGETICETNGFEYSGTSPKGLTPRLTSLRTSLCKLNESIVRKLSAEKHVYENLLARPEPADPAPLLDEFNALDDEHHAVLEQLTNGAQHGTASMAEVDKAFEDLESIRAEADDSYDVEAEYQYAFDALRNKYQLYLARSQGQKVEEADLPTIAEVRSIVRRVDVIRKLNNAKESHAENDLDACETLTIDHVGEKVFTVENDLDLQNESDIAGPPSI